MARLVKSVLKQIMPVGGYDFSVPAFMQSSWFEGQSPALADDEFWADLKYVLRAVEKVCDDVGCVCLASRFRYATANPDRSSSEPCPSCGRPGCQPYYHLLAKLAPLTHALAQTGYYDLAMFTAELAFWCEPTLDLDLARAHYAVILGEMEAAAEIYHGVLKRRMQLPPDTLENLAALAATHFAEDDIQDLYHQLKRHQA